MPETQPTSESASSNGSTPEQNATVHDLIAIRDERSARAAAEVVDTSAEAANAEAEIAKVDAKITAAEQHAKVAEAKPETSRELSHKALVIRQQKEELSRRIEAAQESGDKDLEDALKLQYGALAQEGRDNQEAKKSAKSSERLTEKVAERDRLQKEIGEITVWSGVPSEEHADKALEFVRVSEEVAGQDKSKPIKASYSQLRAARDRASELATVALEEGRTEDAQALLKEAGRIGTYERRALEKSDKLEAPAGDSPLDIPIELTPYKGSKYANGEQGVEPTPDPPEQKPGPGESGDDDPIEIPDWVNTGTPPQVQGEQPEPNDDDNPDIHVNINNTNNNNNNNVNNVGNTGEDGPDDQVPPIQILPNPIVPGPGDPGGGGGDRVDLPPAEPLPYPENPRDTDHERAAVERELATRRLQAAAKEFARANVNRERIFSGKTNQAELDRTQQELNAAYEAWAIAMAQYSPEGIELNNSREGLALAGEYQQWSENRLQQLLALRSLPEANRPADLEDKITEQQEYQQRLAEWTAEREARVQELEAGLNAEINIACSEIDGLVDQYMTEEREQRHPVLSKVNKYFREHPKTRMWIGGALVVAGVASAAVGLLPVTAAVITARAALTGSGIYSAWRGRTQAKADAAMAETQRFAQPGDIEAQTGARVERTRRVRRGKRQAAVAGGVTAGAMMAWGLTHLPPGDPGDPGSHVRRVASVNEHAADGSLRPNSGLFTELSPQQLANSREHWTSLLTPQQVQAIGPEQAAVFDHLTNAAQLKIPTYLNSYLPGLAA